MPISYAYATLAAILSSGLFVAIYGSGLGFLFLFLPTLPLLAIGLSRYHRMVWAAVWGAFFLIALLAGPYSAALFLGFLGIPTVYLAKMSIIHVAFPGGIGVLWIPMGRIITGLTLYACGVVAMITLFYMTQPTSLPQMLADNIREAFSDLSGDYQPVIDALADRLSFLIFSITIWLWAIALYAHAWVVNRVLIMKKRHIRPSYAIEMFLMPPWMLSLMAICALASLIGSPSVSFLGKTTLISLLLPYFFLGVAVLQKMSANWSSRRFFLFFIYFVVFAQFWPALIISGIGLLQQIKHLSGSGSWFKS